MQKEMRFLNTLIKSYKDDTPYCDNKKKIVSKLSEEYTSNEKRKRVLEMGCSNGYETQLLSSRFKEVDVIDGSDVFINKLKSMGMSDNVTFHFSHFEDFKLGLGHKPYDYIFCNYVLEHVIDPVLVLKNIIKSLKPGGLIFITVPNSNAFSRQLALKMKLIKKLKGLTENDRGHGHRRVYDQDTIIRDCKKAKLSIVDVRGVIFKILADFQLDKMLECGVIEEKHFEGLQEMADLYKDFSDSLFVVGKKATIKSDLK